MRNKSFHLRWKRRIILIVFLFFPVQADIGTDLMGFFNKVGMQSNVTTPGSYQNQSAGYYSGGGMSVRAPTRTLSPMSFQMPGYRAGCGGIDLWTGGFSHIKLNELMGFLRSIGTNAASYGFMLALQTVSPQIANILSELNNLATMVNQTNINSCETAATMLGGLWPKSDQASKHLCQSMGSNLGVFSDWAGARHGCGAKGDREQVFNSGNSGKEKYKDMLKGEFNLAWKAIQANDFLKADTDLAELFLTLVGSIIARKQGESMEIKVLPGHSDRDDLLTGLLQGGQTPIYRCDSKEECLDPTLRKVNLPLKSTLFQKVSAILDSLVQKIDEDGELTAEEKGFLNSTQIPIYKILNVLTAFRKGQAPVDIQSYADLISLDILSKYILDVIDLVNIGLINLRSIQVDDTQVERFLGFLKTARKRITERRQSAFAHMDFVLSIIESTQLIEKQLHTLMGTVASDLNWS